MPVSLDEARESVDFPLLVPAAEADAYLDRSVPRMVNLRWGPYVLSQWPGEQLPFVEKQAGPRSRIVNVLVGDDPGAWITGARHEVVYRNAQGEVLHETRRLVGNVLIWERDGITYRLEGAGTRAEALAVARNLRAALAVYRRQRMKGELSMRSLLLAAAACARCSRPRPQAAAWRPQASARPTTASAQATPGRRR